MDKSVFLRFILLGQILSNVCYGDDNLRYIAAQFGQAFVTTGTSENYFTYGGRVGTGLFRDNSGIFSLGLSVNTNSQSATLSGVSISARTTPVLAELITREAWGTGLFLGGRVGVGLLSANVTTASLNLSGTATSLAVGPALGYEFSITETSNLVLDFSWISIGKGTLTLPTLGSIPYDASSLLVLQAGAVYHW